MKFDLPSDREASGRSLGDEELVLLTEVIRSGSLNSNSGQMVRRFEVAFADHCGMRHAIACTSGSLAVQAAVFATTEGRRGEVVTSPITDFGALTAILYEDMKPRFCDVDPDTLVPTATCIERVLRDDTRAVIATHLFGHPAEVDAIAALCRARGLPLIEDAAQALGTFRAGRAAGTWGDLATFSFQQSKHITAGEGGVVVTDDAELARRVRLFVNKAWPYGEPDPDHLFRAPNGRMSELQAAVLLAQVAKLPALLERRRASATALLDELSGVEGVRVAELAPGDLHGYWRIALIVDDAAGLAQRLQPLGIACQPHYIGRPAFELRAFVELGLSEERERFPGAVRGLDAALVLPWNEGIDPDLACAVGQSIAGEARAMLGEVVP
ncbi:MAG: aminotransferase DegT [Planctomycetes bacterium]|nr:aminotransferase DegT [Planctomycetota bacterium]MDP6425144.1 DegT/DnrJ/EryC1/StrS family aminotransferase [Planctomycetota bacterium]